MCEITMNVVVGYGLLCVGVEIGYGVACLMMPAKSSNPHDEC